MVELVSNMKTNNEVSQYLSIIQCILVPSQNWLFGFVHKWHNFKDQQLNSLEELPNYLLACEYIL